MNTETQPNKIVSIIDKDDGTQLRVTGEIFYGAGLHPSIDVMVHRRKNKEAPWELLNNRPADGWLTMTVDQYIKEGRSEVLKELSHGHLIKLLQPLHQTIKQHNVQHSDDYEPSP